MNKNSSVSIFQAIDEKNIGLLREILQKKPNLLVYDPTSYEDTPLHKAIRLQQIELVKLLLQYNAPLEAKNKFDDTPLHLAVMTGNDEIVIVLIAAGANVNARNDNHKLPIDIAKEYKFNSIVDLLSKFEIE